jgi:hypothetical protein
MGKLHLSMNNDLDLDAGLTRSITLMTSDNPLTDEIILKTVNNRKMKNEQIQIGCFDFLLLLHFTEQYTLTRITVDRRID